MQDLLDILHEQLVTKIAPAAAYVPVQLVYVGGLLVAAALILVWMSLIAMGWIYLERKVAGYIQARVGPNRVHIRVGPLKVLPPGWLQSLADGVKLLTKEDIVPKGADRVLYELAPLLVFVGAFIPFVAIPFSQRIVIADMDLGAFFVLGFGALEVVGILMAGWAPNSKWTLYGGMRLAAQMLSYEIPLGLSVVSIVVLAGSLNLTDIVLWQTTGVFFVQDVNTWWCFDWLNWAVFKAPWVAIPGFLIFYVAGLAEAKRAPFDLPEAESELVSGFHTEYTGIRFSYFFLAEYCAMYLISALGAVLFLGGWHWPLPTVFHAESAGILPGILERIGPVEYQAATDASAILANVGVFLKVALWEGPLATIAQLLQWKSIVAITNELFGLINLVGKAFVLLFIMLWLRWTLPRVRIDQVMHMCLKVLMPFGLALVLVAAFTSLLFESSYRNTPVKRYDVRASAIAGHAVYRTQPGVTLPTFAPILPPVAPEEPAPAPSAAAPAPVPAAPSAPAPPREPGAPLDEKALFDDGFDNH